MSAKDPVLVAVAVVVSVVIAPAGTFADVPPPVRYLIVSVVLLGACPYVLVNKKLDGSNDWSNLLIVSASPNFLMYVGSGKNSSSLAITTPDPN
jgi:hypothetical protein